MWTKDPAASTEPPAENSVRRPAGPLTPTGSRKLPMAMRERRPALAALAVLLILGGALATTILVKRADQRVSAIVITREIGAGRPFDPKSMREALVVEPGVVYERWADRERVSRSVAAVTLLPGTLVTMDMTVDWNKELVPGKARVGLALKPGQVPNDMRAGQRVQVVLVSPGSAVTGGLDGRVLAESALVDSVRAARDRTQPLVTVIVDSVAAPSIAAYASAGQIAITELPGGR